MSVCSVHLRSVVQRHNEIVDAGVREVVVFHSSAQELLRYEADLPFAVIADPTKDLYREFGVESSPRAILNPRLWVTMPRVIWNATRDIASRRRRVPPMTPTGGQLGLPADFLIAADGTVLDVQYGTHAYDQWPVDELLERAESSRWSLTLASAAALRDLRASAEFAPDAWSGRPSSTS